MNPKPQLSSNTAPTSKSKRRRTDNDPTETKSEIEHNKTEVVIEHEIWNETETTAESLQMCPSWNQL